MYECRAGSYEFPQELWGGGYQEKRGSPCQLVFKDRFWDWSLRMKYIRRRFGKVGNMTDLERENNRERDFSAIPLWVIN